MRLAAPVESPSWGAECSSFRALNTYTGGTTVSGGTLVGTTDSLQGSILNNSAVTFNQNTDGTYAGTMSGTGQLFKLGTGNLTLTGSNNYSGGTIVENGTLTGNTTSLQGDIENDATVVFNQISGGTYAGQMTGSGALIKTGAGELTLTGANSYGGGTTVSAGILAGTTSSLQGDILNNSSVLFNQAVDGIYAGNMTGSGSLVKDGVGTVDSDGLEQLWAAERSSAPALCKATPAACRATSPNNASVIFNQATDGTYAGSMTGSGSVIKTDIGSVSFTGRIPTSAQRRLSKAGWPSTARSPATRRSTWAPRSAVTARSSAV